MKDIAEKVKGKLSLVICVYNEKPNIRPLVDKIYSSLEGFDFEIIYVDDGSTDGTAVEIKSLKKSEIILIELKKNYGQSSALSAGIEHAGGEYIVTLDGDLQNDPADIPMMLEKLVDEELDMVAGIRTNRKDGTFFRKIPSGIANWLIRSITRVKLEDYGCTLKVFRRETARDIGLYGELHRFIPVLTSLEGGRMGQVGVRHFPRKHGISKYGLGRTTRVMSDLVLMLFLIRYMQKPMHLFGGAGIISLLAGSAINIYLLILKLAGEDIWGKPLLILGVILVIAGFQLITIGIISELLMRVYYESQQKKPYRIRKITRWNG